MPGSRVPPAVFAHKDASDGDEPFEAWRGEVADASPRLVSLFSDQLSGIGKQGIGHAVEAFRAAFGAAGVEIVTKT